MVHMTKDEIKTLCLATEESKWYEKPKTRAEHGQQPF